MAVPKKRTSKTKTRTRRTIWKKKAEKQATKLNSLVQKLMAQQEAERLLKRLFRK